MFTFPTFIVCTMGLLVFALKATSTGCRRKRGGMGPRAFQSRLVSPIFWAVLSLVALTITQIECFKDIGVMFIAVLVLFALFTSFTVPFAIVFWLIILFLSQWTNVFALIAVLSMATALGYIAGFVLGGPKRQVIAMPPTTPKSHRARLWPKWLPEPTALRLAISKPLVKPIWIALPEFNLMRHDHKKRPVGRGDIGRLNDPPSLRFNGKIEFATRRQDFALTTDQGDSSRGCGSPPEVTAPLSLRRT
ncbi:hypothetical protein ASE04_04905 [Rhizobium sp. Root708]|nr:hypothetical protein ASE04_04905 [Rhizobium sp. Root708]